MFLRGQKFTTEDIPHFLRSENRKSFPAKLATKKKIIPNEPYFEHDIIVGLFHLPIIKDSKGALKKRSYYYYMSTY